MTTTPCSRCGGSGVEVDDREVGKQMRTVRMQRGLSLRLAAELLGITPSYLSDLELGRRRWSPERIEITRQLVTTWTRP